MYRDPIVEEVRKIRDELAKRFDYDIRKIVENARKEQRESGRKTVSFPPRKPKTEKIKRPVSEKA